MQSSAIGHETLPTLRNSRPAGRRPYNRSRPFVAPAPRRREDHRPRFTGNWDFCKRLKESQPDREVGWVSGFSFTVRFG